MTKRVPVVIACLACSTILLAALPQGFLRGPAPIPRQAEARVTNPEAARVSGEAAASAYLPQAVERLGLDLPGVGFKLLRTEVDGFGASHVRFQETYEGVPVIGRELVAHVNNAAAGVFAVGSSADVIPPMDVRAALGPAQASRIAKEAFRAVNGPDAASAEARLVIVGDCSGYHLAYEVRVSNVLHETYEPAEWRYFVDGGSGAILDSWNDLHTKGKPGGSTISYTKPVTGTGQTLYSGSVSLGTAQASDGSSNYALKDLVRGSTYTTDMNSRTSGSGTLFTATSNTWGDGTNADRATAGADAHFGTDMTWDFYSSSFGRNGISNDGKGSYSRVHYGRNYNNAFWSDSCYCMTYGDGDGRVLSPLVSLDVAGHEMSHGVTSATSNLAYSGESGGLNESFSDIMGTGVEYYAATHGAQRSWDYWIGEDVYTPGTPGDALRYMDDPTRDGSSIDNYANYTSSLDVHYSSGIWNNWFYLLAHGGTNRTSGLGVTGIGIDKALAVAYLANTGYFTSSESFSKARQDCIAAATQLYGANSSEVAGVGQAWTAVGVN